jgi:flagellar basal-body rod protein FlgG
MSVQTLYTAATGMNSLETKLDVIANNLANSNTTAFKRGTVNFEDLFYRNLKLPALQDATGNYTPTGIAVGLGTRVQSTGTDFTQGNFIETNDQLDVAISGRGFFQVTDPNTGQIVYTRAGNLALNSTNQLVVESAQVGRVLQPAISLPQDYTGIIIGQNGSVQVQQYNNTNFTQVGQLQLANFVNPEGLLKLGENLYQYTNASGPPLLANPGQNGVGTLQQSALEASNVEPVTELVDLITTQRSFELNSQALQAGDQILQLVANLRRY